MATKKNTTPLEVHEQMRFVRHLQELKDEGKILHYSAVPNNTYTKSMNQKRKAKAEGVRPGVPDLIIVTETKVFFLEMKRQKASYPRPEQREWLEVLDGKEVIADWAKGADEAIEKLNTILGGK